MFLVIPYHRYWDFKLLLEQAKPTSVDSSSDKPKAPIRNFGSQPLEPINLSYCHQFTKGRVKNIGKCDLSPPPHTLPPSAEKVTLLR